MEVIIQPDPDKVCKQAAQIVAKLVRTKPNAVLGLSAGSSQLGMYRELIRMHREEGLDFSMVRTFNVDEYVGLSPDHPNSYHAVMRSNFFSLINIKPENTHIPDGLTNNIPFECERYEAQIKISGGIDLQILGVGEDGHIGFNEPTSSLGSRTRLKTLTEKTRYVNSRFFNSLDEVPKFVITIGIGTIMSAEKVMLLAFGQRKEDVITRVVEGPLSAMIPASVLQMHPGAKILVDDAAAAGLRMKDYYKWVYSNKPGWQQLS